MDHLLHILDRIEELLRELIVAEVRRVTIELKGFDVIHSLVHVCCELVNTFPEGVGLPPFPKTIREKGVHLELEKKVVGRLIICGGNTFRTNEISDVIISRIIRFIPAKIWDVVYHWFLVIHFSWILTQGNILLFDFFVFT